MESELEGLAVARAFRFTFSCVRLGCPAQRDADTMDTFVDSSWYFLRYTDPDNAQQPFAPELVSQWMPVDVYVGGKEHGGCGS